MEKLLHERLRFDADMGEAFTMLNNGANRVFLKQQEKRDLADEIERYYIPRPRFEDGTPVQFGDEVEGCDGFANCFLLFNDGSGTIYGEQDDVWEDNSATIGADISGLNSFYVKRPAKVLDADGVEIKVGDTVWELDSCQKEIIKEVNSLFMCTTESGTCPHPKNLTHREPDSLEKLRDDMLNAEPPFGSITAGKWADRLTAIMERE